MFVSFFLDFWGKADSEGFFGVKVSNNLVLFKDGSPLNIANTKLYKDVLKDTQDIESQTLALHAYKFWSKSIFGSNRFKFNKNWQWFLCISMEQRLDRAEALLSLLQVETNSFNRTAEDIIKVKVLTPHSILQIQLGRTILNYLKRTDLEHMK